MKKKMQHYLEEMVSKTIQAVVGKKHALNKEEYSWEVKTNRMSV